MRRATTTITLLLLLLLLAPLTAACGGDDEPTEAEVRRTQAARQPPRTVAPLPSDTPAPTATPTETATPSPADSLIADGGEGEAGFAGQPIELPLDPQQTVVQIARVAHSPWEPEILGQMTPHFALQADGFAVFAHPEGPSRDGWYQSKLTPDDTRRFLGRLVSDLDVLAMADHYQPEVRFETARDGSAAATAAVGVIYVRTASREGRLTITQAQLADADGPFGPQRAELLELLEALELWKRGVVQTYDTGRVETMRQRLGWWSDIRQPYSPPSAVAFGTAARLRIPSEAPVAVWPLAAPLDETFEAAYGEAPTEVVLTGGDVGNVLQAARQRPASFWGPLWVDAPGANDRYTIGVRAGVPGGNHVVIDYTFVLPKRGLQPPGG